MEVVFVSYVPPRGKNAETCQAKVPGCNNPCTRTAVLGIHKVSCCDNERCQTESESLLKEIDRISRK